jgi:surfeit locus 1 family protein
MAFRRPSILTVVLALVGLAIMLSLGFWQLERLDWKTQLLATVDARLQKLPLPLPATPSDDWEFRRVTVEGPVAGGQWFRFPGRTRDNQVGDALMLLIQRDDGSLVAVEGVLRHRLEPGIFTPNNDPAHNAWYSVNPAAMAETAGLDSTLALSQYLKPSDWVPSMPNDHLQYAITWFALAGVFCVIFILFHRKKRSAP